jgi:hypothetical protein
MDGAMKPPSLPADVPMECRLRLVSLWNLMLKLNANVLVQFVRTLTAYQVTAGQQKDPAMKIDEPDVRLVEQVLVSCDDAHRFFWLPVTAKRRERIARRSKSDARTLNCKANCER